MVVEADRRGGLLIAQIRNQRPGAAVQNDAERLRKKPVRNFLRSAARQIGKARGGVSDGIDALAGEIVFQQTPHAGL